MCGQSCCELCLQNVRRLSKIDKKAYPICDRCDHTLSNKQVREKLKNDISYTKKMTEDLSQIIDDQSKKLITCEDTFNESITAWAK